MKRTSAGLNWAKTSSPSWLRDLTAPLQKVSTGCPQGFACWVQLPVSVEGSAVKRKKKPPLPLLKTGHEGSGLLQNTMPTKENPYYSTVSWEECNTSCVYKVWQFNDWASLIGFKYLFYFHIHFIQKLIGHFIMQLIIHLLGATSHRCSHSVAFVMLINLTIIIRIIPPTAYWIDHLKKAP